LSEPLCSRLAATLFSRRSSTAQA